MLFRYVRDYVLELTGKRQEPFIYGPLLSKAIYLAVGTGAEGGYDVLRAL